MKKWGPPRDSHLPRERTEGLYGSGRPRKRCAMPQRVICSKCGHVLYEEEEDLKPPDEVVQMFEDERCPKCGHKLEVIPVKVVIRPLKPIRPRRSRR